MESVWTALHLSKFQALSRINTIGNVIDVATRRRSEDRAALTPQSYRRIDDGIKESRNKAAPQGPDAEGSRSSNREVTTRTVGTIDHMNKFEAQRKNETSTGNV